MIVFTTPQIKTFNPIRISSIVKYAGCDHVLAEFTEGWSITEDQMEDSDVAFWWALSPGFFNPEDFDYDKKYRGGIIEGIELTYNVSKEVNIAMAIYVISRNAGLDPFEIWEKTIQTTIPL